MEYNNDINELIDSLLAIIQIDDESFNNGYEEIISNLEANFNNGMKDNLIKKSLEELSIRNATEKDAYDSGKEALEAYYGIFTTLKNQTSNEFKKSFLDEIYSFVESIVNETYNAYSPNVQFVKVQLLNNAARIPTYAHEDDQGADVYSSEEITLAPHTYGNMIHTGVALAIPHGWAIGVRARSGLSRKTTLRLSNCYGTIDTSYKDEICVLLDNIGDEPVTIHVGDRIAQLVLEKNYHAFFEQTEDVKQFGSDREGGFGSTGA